jgi:quercetin dioxygenase-like cupin family protein
VMYRIPPRYRGAMHSHPAAQLGVILEGTGEHRMLLTVQRGGRARQELTEIGLRPGDYFFVPSGVPHDFSVADESPVVCVEMTLGAGSPALAAELLPRRSRGVRRVR